MPEGSRWVPMNGRGSSRNFGVYREADKDGIKPASRVLLVLACLSAAALVICFTTLSITKSKGKNRIESVLGKKAFEIAEEIDKDIFKEIGKEVTTEQAIELKIDRKIDENPEDSSFTHVANKIRFPEKEEEEEMYVDQISSRKGKLLERMHPRVPQRPKIDNADYFTPQQYSEQYPQLDGFRTQTIKSVQDVIGLAKPQLTVSPNGQATVKFSGVYIRTPESDGGYEEESVYTKAKPYNGHAYAADPFKPYKPSHPSEINHLATFSSEIDTGPRFSNKIVRPTKTPVADSGTLSSQTQLTQAIFHPYEPVLPTPTLKPERKQKPLKIMLDIYPVTPSTEPSVVFTDMRKIQPPQYQGPARPQGKRMIVHLNLYPKRAKQKRQHQTLTSLVPGGGNFEDRMFDDSDGYEESDETIHLRGEASQIVEMPEDVEYPTGKLTDSPPLGNAPQHDQTAVPELNVKKPQTSNPVDFLLPEYFDSTESDYVFEQEELNSEEEREGRELIDVQVNPTNTSHIPSHLH